MTLAQLRYLVAVDTHRHFARAAAACNVSQPTLSMAIRKAEEEVGAPLFDRSRKPIRPTALGVELLTQARVVLRESRRLDDVIAGSAGAVAGELQIGIIPTLAPYLLPWVTRRFAEAYPLVSLSLHEMTTSDILAALASERIDAGLIATRESLPGTVHRPLYNEEFVAYLSPDHRLARARSISTKSLALEDLWLLSEGHCFRRQVLDICGEGTHSCGPQRSVLFESGNLETLRHMVESSGGMTLLPRSAIFYLSAAQRKKFVRYLAPPAPHREVAMLYGREVLKKHVIDAYVETLIRALPREIGKIAGEA